LRDRNYDVLQRERPMIVAYLVGNQDQLDWTFDDFLLRGMLSDIGMSLNEGNQASGLFGIR
jgi:hypothetical protein